MEAVREGPAGALHVHKKREMTAKSDAEARLDIKACNVFVEPGCDIGDEQAFKRALRTHSLQRVHDRLHAHVFVVANLGALGQRVRWCCMLGGGLICDVKCIVAGGHSGASIGLKAATLSKRQIWCSPEFVAKHPEVHKIITCKAQLPSSNWRWVQNKQQLLDLGTRRTAAGHGGEVVAFVTAKEQTSEERPL